MPSVAITRNNYTGIGIFRWHHLCLTYADDFPLVENSSDVQYL